MVLSVFCLRSAFGVSNGFRTDCRTSSATNRMARVLGCVWPTPGESTALRNEWWKAERSESRSTKHASVVYRRQQLVITLVVVTLVIAAAARSALGNRVLGRLTAALQSKDDYLNTT